MNIFKILSSILIVSHSLFASECIIQDEKTPKSLHLIVGSTRSKESISLWREKITGSGNDFTHKNTFEGKAISLDIFPSHADSMLPHIQADARTFIPRIKIDAVYMELFPSIDVHTLGKTQASGNTENKIKQMMSMPDAIKNLAQYMNPRAKLEIEHIPYITLLDEKFYVAAVSYLRKENPFNCFLSPLFIENLEARKQIGLDSKISYWNEIRRDCLERRKWSPDDTSGIIHEAVISHHFLLRAIDNIKNLLSLDSNAIEKRLEFEHIEYVKNPVDFLSQKSGSLISTIAEEFSTLSQEELVCSFLKVNGFEDIFVIRQDSIVNGRRNVWIISGRYKSS